MRSFNPSPPFTVLFLSFFVFSEKDLSRNFASVKWYLY